MKLRRVANMMAKAGLDNDADGKGLKKWMRNGVPTSHPGFRCALGHAVPLSMRIGRGGPLICAVIVE